MRPAGIVHGAVFRNRAHGNGIDRVLRERRGGEIAGSIGHLLRKQRVAGAVGNAHIVGLHVAVGAPGEVDAVHRRVEVIDAAGNRVDGRNADYGHAHIARRGRGRSGGNRRGRGLDVNGRVVGEQKLLRLHGSHASDIQTRGILEQFHRRFGHRAEVAGDVGVIIAQVAQAALQGGHAVVGIAALQGDIAAVLGRVRGKQPALQRRRGNARLRKAYFGLEAADGGHGGVVEGAAGRALIVVQFLEALVELAHAVARIALFHIDIALAGARAGSIEPLQRFARGRSGGGQAVFLLEDGHGLLRTLAVDAVRAVGQEAQAAQAVLHDGNAQAGVAARKGLVGVVGGQVFVKEHILQLRRGHAVDREAAVGQVCLQKPHGVLRVRAKDAVGIVVEVAQFNQALLQGAHGFAAAAARERAVFFLGFEHVHGGVLIRHRPDGDQMHALLGIGLFRGRFAKGEGRRGLAVPAFGLQVFGRKYAVEVDLAAHGLQTQAGKRVAVRSQAFQVAAIVQLQRTFLDVGAIDFARALVEQEQRLGAGGNLRHFPFQRGHHAPRHLRGVKRLEAALAGHGADVINHAVQIYKILDAEINKLHFAAGQRLDAQHPLAAQAQIGFFRIERVRGKFPRILGKTAGALVV